MDTALNPAATHRADGRLHVLTPSSAASPQTVRVRAFFRLSEVGRRASLLTGPGTQEMAQSVSAFD
jgi:hypothetical protein